MMAAMKKPTRSAPRKNTSAKKSASKSSSRVVRVRLDDVENAGLNAEVTKRRRQKPGATRESVVRELVRTHLCKASAGPAAPKARGALTVVQTKPVKDEHGRKMTLRIGSVEQVFRWVPPGTFMQGSPEAEAGRWDDEGPQHEVELRHGYWLADTPVTQALWQAVMQTNPSRFKGDERPVETVSWDDARDFIARLNGLAPGLNARLPTEAEWENACRAGTTKATWMGDLDLTSDGVRAAVLNEIAWYYGNSPDGTKPVRGKQPNPMGLYDMLGNVWEWCSDFYGPYQAGRLTDPTGPAEGSCRVIRGGGWSSRARDVRAANRSGDVPRDRDDVLGFRLARGHQA